ncbi:MAG: hypothetical protein JWO30_591 [Fibrobacteres bacterium]|nr:hypothetical protein [Fibrobacterota bacterium]
MTESASASGLRRTLPIPTFPATLILAALLMAACVFDKPVDEVQLDLTRVPAKVDSMRVMAVDPLDTSKVLAVVYAAHWQPGKTLRFSLGDASGKDWLLRAEGYQGEYLIYLSLISSGTNGRDSAVLVPVNRGLPAVFFKGVQRDNDSVRFSTAFRSSPNGVHWHFNIGPDTVGNSRILMLTTPGAVVAAALLKPGSLLTVDLHLADHTPLPVQEPDTMLADEALAPAGSQVHITEAYREGDSVHLLLTYVNFQAPDVDEPKPGRGFPIVLDKSTFTSLPEFKVQDGDPTHLAGPASALSKVKFLLVALTYANHMRIRPMVWDTIESTIALKTREARPSVHIDSQTVNGDILTLFLTRTNFEGFHLHIYRDFITWPSPPLYQTCYTSVCQVGANIWKGAGKVIVVAQRESTHDVLRPLVSDTLLIPPP